MSTAVPTNRTLIKQQLLAHWSLVVLALTALPYMGIVTLSHSAALSPIDEWVYVDALIKLPTQGIVHEGELVGTDTLEMLSCQGVSPFGTTGSECGSEYLPADYPNEGLSTVAGYVPLYFTVTRFIGDGIRLVTGSDPLTGWRLTGLLWLLGGLVGLYALLRSWGASHVAVLAAGAAFVASPFSWWTYSYVSTDAPSFLFGAVLLLLAGKSHDSRVARWCLLVVSAVAIAFKVSNLIGVALALLYVVIESAVRARRAESPLARRRSLLSSLRAVGFATTGLAAGATIQVLWLDLARSWAVSTQRADQGITIPLTLDEFLLQFATFLPGTITSSPISAHVPSYVYAPLGWLTVAGVLTAFAVLAAPLVSRTQVPLVLSVSVASVLAAPALALALEVVNGAYFQLPPRYGATLLPGFLALLALVLRNRVAAVIIVTYSGALMILGVWLSVFLATLA